MNTTLISLGILLAGLVVCLTLVFRAKRKAKAIVHYESMRDKLSLDENEIEEVTGEFEYGESSFRFLNHIIAGFIAIMVGLTILPKIVVSVEEVCNTNIVNASCNLIQFIPVLFILSIVSIVIGIVNRRVTGTLAESGLC